MLNKKNSTVEDKDHGTSRITYTVDESGSAIIDGSVHNTDVKIPSS